MVKLCMAVEYINIEGANAHNLKNLNLKIHLNSITCLCGPSGSGKSSLAVETLYKIAKKHFINSLSADQQFFWSESGGGGDAKVTPVLPTWYLPQQNRVTTSRLRVVDGINLSSELAQLFFNYGNFFCRIHNEPFVLNSLEYQLREFFENCGDIVPLHFLVSKDNLVERGTFSRSYDENSHEIREFNDKDQFVEIYRTKKIDILKIISRINELNVDAFYLYSKLLKQLVFFSKSKKLVCSHGDSFFPPINWSSFSPLLAHGACKVCRGHGDMLEYDRRKVIPKRRLSLEEGACSILEFKRFKKYKTAFFKFCNKHHINISKPFEQVESEKLWELIEQGDKDFLGLNKLYAILEKKKYKKPYRIFASKFKSRFPCPACQGTRISALLHNSYITISEKKIFYLDVLQMNILDIYNLLCDFQQQHGLSLNFIKSLKVAIELKIGHLSLHTSLDQLLVNEYQRVLLVKYLSYQGSGNLFILDEPTSGLSQKEQKILVKQLRSLQKQGNTILVIEHSEVIKKSADQIIELGPGAGKYGGEILFQGSYSQYSLQKVKHFSRFSYKLDKSDEKIIFKEIILNNFFRNSLELPLAELVAVYGDAITGKSKIFKHVVLNELSLKLRGEFSSFVPYSVGEVILPACLTNFCSFYAQTKAYSSRSTIGTLLGLTPTVRKYYSSLREASAMNLKDGHFSANSPLGQCRGCGGRGLQVVEMDILQDVSFVCQDCKGKKIIPLYADISDGVQSFYDAVSNPMEDILGRIPLTPKLQKIFNYLKALRLDYLSLDRSFNSLSGGEKQRIMLIVEIAKSKSATLFFFENLSVGLSVEDLEYVIDFLFSLIHEGHSVILLDENPIWRKCATTIIDF